MRTFEDKFLRKHGVSLAQVRWRLYVLKSREEERRQARPAQITVGRLIIPHHGFFKRILGWLVQLFRTKSAMEVES